MDKRRLPDARGECPAREPGVRAWQREPGGVSHGQSSSQDGIDGDEAREEAREKPGEVCDGGNSHGRSV